MVALPRPGSSWPAAAPETPFPLRRRRARVMWAPRRLQPRTLKPHMASQRGATDIVPSGPAPSKSAPPAIAAEARVTPGELEPQTGGHQLPSSQSRPVVSRWLVRTGDVNDRCEGCLKMRPHQRSDRSAVNGLVRSMSKRPIRRSRSRGHRGAGSQMAGTAARARRRTRGRRRFRRGIARVPVVDVCKVAGAR